MRFILLIIWLTGAAQGAKYGGSYERVMLYYAYLLDCTFMQGSRVTTSFGGNTGATFRDFIQHLEPQISNNWLSQLDNTKTPDVMQNAQKLVASGVTDQDVDVDKVMARRLGPGADYPTRHWNMAQIIKGQMFQVKDKPAYQSSRDGQTYMANMQMASTEANKCRSRDFTIAFQNWMNDPMTEQYRRGTIPVYEDEPDDAVTVFKSLSLAKSVFEAVPASNPNAHKAAREKVMGDFQRTSAGSNVRVGSRDGYKAIASVDASC